MDRTVIVILIPLVVFASVIGYLLFGRSGKAAVGDVPVNSEAVLGALESVTTPEASPSVLPSLPTQASSSADPNSEVDLSKLNIYRLKAGTGPGTKNGDNLTVHYTGTLLDGKKFDSSLDREQPITFTLGAGQVIQGWDQGLLDMKVGEQRKLIIPPSLGYGVTGTPGGPIPPNATLIFEVALIKID